MKLPLVLLFTGVTLFNVACKEKEEKIDIDTPLGTALVYDETFVLEDNGLVSAHQYVVNFTAQGGTVDLKIVSSGIRGNGQYISSDQFCSELLDKMIDGDDSGVQIYDYFDQKRGIRGEIVKKPRYIQTLRITAQPNPLREQQEAQISISTDAVDFFYTIAHADITLRQAGAK